MNRTRWRLLVNWTTPQASVDRVQDAIGAALAEMRLR